MRGVILERVTPSLYESIPRMISGTCGRPQVDGSLCFALLGVKQSETSHIFTFYYVNLYYRFETEAYVHR